MFNTLESKGYGCGQAIGNGLGSELDDLSIDDGSGNGNSSSSEDTWSGLIDGSSSDYCSSGYANGWGTVTRNGDGAGEADGSDCGY